MLVGELMEMRSNDFDRKFAGGTAKVVPKRKKEPLVGVALEKDNAGIYMDVCAGKDFDRQYFPFGDIAAFVWDWPVLGNLNYRRGVVRLSRSTQHNRYKYTMTASAVDMSDLCRDERRLLAEPATSRRDLLTPTIIKSLYHPRYFSTEKAVSLMESGSRFGTAISPNLALTHRWDSPHIQLSYKGVIIGFVRTGGGHIRAEIDSRVPELIEEVAEYITIM